MKISLEWISQYLPGPLAAEQAADALTNGGLPVELIERHGDDAVIDVEVTSNRGDCLSHVGIARELSALLGRKFLDVAPRAAESTEPVDKATSVTIEAPDLCPHYTARVLRNVKVGPSPAWMARRLEAVGLRPINNVVDVTNYVMFEMGQPLHAFDFDKLDGRRVVVRRAGEKETLVSIDGHQRTLAPDMLVIADASRPVALAGVMGGRDSEVSSATTSILLESARFDPLCVRKTARRLSMKSDSSYRFERGIDPTLPERASLRAAQLILEIAGGELLRGFAFAGESGHSPRKITLRLARLRQVLGVELPTHEVVGALARLGLRPVDQGKHIDVTVPSHRLDLNIEVDLIEEAARVIGYDKVPVKDEIAIRVSPPEPELVTLGVIRQALTASGYFEAVTFSLAGGPMVEAFLPPDAEMVSVKGGTKVAQLRPSLVPVLLSAVSYNEAVGNSGVLLFEIGQTFWNEKGAGLVERSRLGLVGGADLRDTRGVIEALLARLEPSRAIRVIPDERPGFARGACARIEWDGQPIGYFGKIDRKVHVAPLREPPAAAELDLAPLLAGARHVKQLRPLPKFPPVRRDLTLDVDEATSYARIESAVRSAKPELLESLEYVTTYRGKQVEKGKKSVTIALVFRSPAETLTGEAVEASVQGVVEAARRELGATLRA